MYQYYCKILLLACGSSMGTESADWSITEFWSEYSFKSGKAVSELGVPKH